MQWDLLGAMLGAAGVGWAAWNRWSRPRAPWRWAALLTLLALAPVLPALRAGRVYGPLDTNASRLPWAGAAAARRPAAPQLNDVTLQFVPWQTEARRQLLAGRAPLLNRWSASGQALLGNGVAAPFSATSLLSLPFEPERAQALRAFLVVLLALGGTWLAARQLGSRGPAALAAAVAYGYGGSLSLWRLFPQAEVMALWPFLFLGNERLLAGEGGRGPRALLALAIVGIALAGHPETAAVALFAMALRWLFVSGEDGRRAHARRVRTILAVAALAGLATSFFTLPVAQTILGSEKLRQESGGWRAPEPPGARARVAAAVSLALPGIFAAPRRGGDPGPAPLHWLGEGAVGLAAVVLGIAGALAGGGPAGARRYLVVLAALAYAGHLLVPRLGALAPRYFAYCGAFALALLAALALETWLALGRRGLPHAALPWLAAALGAVQLAHAFGGYVPTVPAAVAYPRLPLLDRLAAEPPPFRIVGTRGVLTPNASTIYELADVRTHDATESARYVAWLVDLLDVDLRSYHKAYRARPEHTPFLRLLGVRFALTGERARLGGGWVDRGLFGRTRLWELPGAVRWAHFPDFVVPVASAPAARAFSRAARPFRAAPLELGGETTGRAVRNGPAAVRRARLTVEGVEVEVTVRREAWLVVAQSAIPGWIAEVDGRRAATAIAHGALVAVRVPAGASRVRLAYRPWTWTAGLALSLAAAAGLALALRAGGG